MTLPAESAAALPIRTSALEPEWIRNGSSAVKKDYQAALQFEQELITQMASSLTKDGELGSGTEEGGEESEPGSSVYSSMLPQALASGVVEGGGLGLAAQMTRQLLPGADTAAEPLRTSTTTGGASAA